MDVPFISSGALSRAHYALVRRVEESASESAVNHILEAEVKSIQEQLLKPGFLLKRSKEALIVLLYCRMTATAPIFPHGAFDFALPHALSLAEAGTTVEDKRVGYLFCAEIMRPDHEIRLLLVNTLRKDLENDSVPRICLALDNMISMCSPDVIPAVQGRIHDLLSHNHPAVRRRALYAVRSLSVHEPELHNQVRPKILRRLQDPDLGVARAALRLVGTLSLVNSESDSAIQDTVNDILESAAQRYTPSERGLTLVSLEVTLRVGLRTLSLPVTFDLACSSGADLAVLLGLYRLFRKFDQTTIRAVEERTKIRLIGIIRDYLTSRTPNEVYLFLSCLECLDPGLWAGTSEDIPAVLEGWEVEQFMQLLDSRDHFIRRKALRLLGEVDSDILNAYYIRAISVTSRTALTLKELNEGAKRLLEVLEVISGSSGELYAGQVKHLLFQLESRPSGTGGVLDSAIEGVLLRIRLGEPTFQITCAATMLTVLCDLDAVSGPTMTVILAAIATEYSRSVSFSPVELLSGICHRLKGSLASVQELCILAMLRIAADCEELPVEVTQTVLEVSQKAGRHIRRRCDQFLTLSSQREVLMNIVKTSRTLALPDFLEALETHSENLMGGDKQNISGAEFPQSSPGVPGAASPNLSASKLRYDAYDTPHAITSLRTGRLSTHRGSRLGSASHQGSPSGRSSSSSVVGSRSRAMTHNTTAFSSEMSTVAQTRERPNLPVKIDMEDLSSRVDLIAFDSPFVVEREREIHRELDFESTWNSDKDLQRSSRGWCDTPIDDVVRRLQGIEQHQIRVLPADMPPFVGDLKITIEPDGADVPSGFALLRLRDSDDDTSLWRLRCSNVLLNDQIKQLLGNQ